MCIPGLKNETWGTQFPVIHAVSGIYAVSAA
jgi:hypothetical protein